MSHVAPLNMLHLCIVMSMSVIIAQLPSLNGTDKSKSSSVLLGCPLLPIIWRELQAHPTLWWDFEVNTFLQSIPFKKLCGTFDDMSGGIIILPCSERCQSITITSVTATHGLNFIRHFQPAISANEYVYLKPTRATDPNRLVINL